MAAFGPAAPALPRSTPSIAPWPPAQGRPPKLLHVFSTFAVGGPQTRTADLIRAFAPGLEHVLVAADGRTEGVAALGLQDLVRPLPLAFAKGAGISPRNLLAIRRLLRRERPDLLLTYNFGALEAALANRFRPLCPHLHVEDGFGPEEGPGVQLRRRIWLRRLALARRSRIVVPSRTLATIARDVWGFPAAQITFLPNGVDLARFAWPDQPEGPDRRSPAARPAPAAAPPSIERRPGEVLVGTVGALRPEKNQARLVQAFATLRPAMGARLVLVGDGPERSRLEGLARELGLADRVMFMGHVERPETVLRALDLFALSSDTEQMPVSLLEAMAAGLPVLATAVGDVGAMLPAAQAPFIQPPEDAAGFAAALARLVGDRDLRRALGAGNREHVRRHFASTVMVEGWRQVIAAAMAKVPAAATAPGRAA